jgi:hypothetical protein
MATLLKVYGQEQTFTSANTFSTSNSTMTSGSNVVRVVNTGNTSGVITINSTPIANITILGLTDIIIKKFANTSMTASTAGLLGVEIDFENN